MARELRHGLKCLWPSELGDQLYCEYKVHLKRLHPEVQLELPALEQGEASHTALASQAEPITAAEIERAIQTGKQLALCEWVLEGNVHDVSIRGRPDFFAFEGKKGLLVLDFKFSGAKGPFRSQEVQAEVYALLAGSMGFSTDELCFGIVLFPPAGHGQNLREAAQAKDAMLQLFNKDGTLHKIYEQCEQARKELISGKAKTYSVESKLWKAFLFRYDAKKAEKDLTELLGYWLGEREPIPEKRYPRKCFACPLNAAGLCEHALQEADPKFEVQRNQDGKVFVYR